MRGRIADLQLLKPRWHVVRLPGGYRSVRRARPHIQFDQISNPTAFNISATTLPVLLNGK
jgi:hypothetical protein